MRMKRSFGAPSIPNATSSAISGAGSNSIPSTPSSTPARRRDRSRAGTPYFAEIVSVDVTGDTAVVKLIDDYLGIRFTDYLTMVKTEGRWIIINKAFYVHG